MVQFNLLPDVKLDYIKSRSKKRMALVISFAVAGFFFAIFLILFLYVRVGQPQHMRAVDKDIKAAVSKLNAVSDLEKILTVQNQLNSLPALHDQKTISSRLFDYLIKMTPSRATISEVNLDLVENTLTLKGSADQLSTVNKFADTLKFTEYKVDGDDARKGMAFSDVVLTSFSISQLSAGSSSDKEVIYTLEFRFDPVIFANIKKGEANGTVNLVVPKIISTRSETLKPTGLFEQQPEGATELERTQGQ